MSGRYPNGLGFAGRLELIKYRTQGLIGVSPRLYRMGLRVRGSSMGTFVVTDTDLCIEAPMGCGNSFIIRAVKMANPGIKVAHHHHVPAQLKESARLGVPAVTILRDPGEAALSRAVSWGDASVAGASIYMWVQFWETWKKISPTVPVVVFEDLIAHPAALLELVNRTYGTGFSTDIAPQEEVFESMDHYRSATYGPGSMEMPRPTRPDPAKSSSQNALRPEVERQRSLMRARRLYHSVKEQVQSAGQ